MTEPKKIKRYLRELSHYQIPLREKEKMLETISEFVDDLLRENAELRKEIKLLRGEPDAIYYNRSL